MNRHGSCSTRHAERMAAPTRSYIICANQRSGSNLLCRALTDTGLAGRPDEWFLCGGPDDFPPGFTFWETEPTAQEHGVSDRLGYIDLVHQLATTENGVFGAKIMFNNVRWIEGKLREVPRFTDVPRRALYEATFPDLHVIHLTRRDRVRQAVSWARAAQDNVWIVTDDQQPQPTGEPDYWRDFIAGLEQLIIDGENGWRALYDEFGLDPYEVVYEDLVTPHGYETAVRGALDHLGVDQPAVLPPPRTHKQADDLNEDWANRYIAET